MYICVCTLPYPSCSHTLARAKRAPKRGEERSLTLGERFPQSVHNWTTEWAVYTVEKKEKWSLPLEALIKWMDRASGRKRAGLKVERECVKYEIRWNNKPGGFRSGCAFALLLALCYNVREKEMMRMLNVEKKLFIALYPRWKEYELSLNSTNLFRVQIFRAQILAHFGGKKKRKKNRVIPKLCEEFVSMEWWKGRGILGYFLSRHLVCTGTKLHTCVRSVTHTHVMLYAHQVTVNLQSFSSCRDRVQCGLLCFSKSW